MLHQRTEKKACKLSPYRREAVVSLPIQTISVLNIPANRFRSRSSELPDCPYARVWNDSTLIIWVGGLLRI